MHTCWIVSHVEFTLGSDLVLGKVPGAMRVLRYDYTQQHRRRWTVVALGLQVIFLNEEG